MPDLIILHTNDLHGKLTREAAGIIARERSACNPCLLLDSGDAISSGNVYWRPGGEPILALMSELGYDGMAMGNREFHFLAAGLRSKLRLAGFPVLCANIRGRTNELGLDIRQHCSWDIHGYRVTVFGLCVPMITPRMLARRMSPFWFEDPIEAAKQLVPNLRDQCDLLVALTHIGLQKDIELAETVSGIDLVVGGHSHAVLSSPRMIGDTTVVQAGWWGHYLGKVSISLGNRMGVTGELIDLRRQS